MRLTCPNCDAQYEVDDRAIPDAGRDVQCSNCGHAWFQLPPGLEEAQEDEAATFGETRTEPEPEVAAEAPAPAPASPASEEPEAEDWEKTVVPVRPVAHDAPPEPDTKEDQPEPELVAEPVPAPEPLRKPEPATRPAMGKLAADAETEADEPTMISEVPAAALNRRTLDENLMSVLREEAEREAKARQGEGGNIETQQEMGLAPSAAQSRARAAILTDDDAETHDDADPTAATAKGLRRDLLPNIEEINSTLRATTERSRPTRGAAAPGAVPAAQGKRGFRMGFGLVLVIALLLTLAYTAAASISARMPALAPAMNAYVATVNQARVGLDRLLQSAAAALGGSKGGA